MQICSISNGVIRDRVETAYSLYFPLITNTLLAVASVAVRGKFLINYHRACIRVREHVRLFADVCGFALMSVGKNNPRS